MTPPARNRLSSIVTRSGDAGTTGMADGRRVPKAGPLVTALGDLDELNSHIGLLRSTLSADSRYADFVRQHDGFLLEQQHALFDLGAALALSGDIDQSGLPDPESLAGWVAQHNEALPPLREFILPGGSMPLAQAHVARTVARRAERNLWRLVEEEPGVDPVAVYLNRLSDALFVFARLLGESDRSLVYWRGPSSDT